MSKSLIRGVVGTVVAAFAMVGLTACNSCNPCSPCAPRNNCATGPAVYKKPCCAGQATSSPCASGCSKGSTMMTVPAPAMPAPAVPGGGAKACGAGKCG